MTQQKRRAAKRPAPRTITVTAPEGSAFVGWSCTARCDFPARWLVDLQGAGLDAVLVLLGRVITEHNFPDTEGDVAADLADVDPWDGLLYMAGLVTEALQRLPPR